ncbi:hypothetical protein NP233_g3803 [Leucocoprinus birnbaumii]|uniref:Uncharacterized protein n=1 Tax=Leucocoprinus birnbaumii TaxID=56174 RepID=A0AAD5YW50_9AGAR|nr:hypothetical protein NP233_g3803 [Leucocoprinus birnbaumii]
MFVRAKLVYTTEFSLDPESGLTSLVLVHLPSAGKNSVEDIGPHLASVGSTLVTLLKEEHDHINFVGNNNEKEGTHFLSSTSSAPSFEELQSTTVITRLSPTPSPSAVHEDQQVYEQGIMCKIYRVDQHYLAFQSFSRFSITEPPIPRPGLTFPEDSVFAHVYKHLHRSEKCIQLWIWSAESCEWISAIRGQEQQFAGKFYQLQWKDTFGASWVRSSK